MSSIPVQLSAPHVLVFSLLLGLVCCAYVILLFRFDFHPRVGSKYLHWINPVDLVITLAFVLAVTGLSVLLIRLPPYLVFP